MRLTLSPEKTAITHVDDGFDLLGFRIVRRPWRDGNKRVAITFPSQRALREVMHRIKTLTTRSTTNLSLDQLIHVLNPIVRIGPTTTATPRAAAASPTSATTCGGE